jgi:hypothetical protein
MTIRHTVRRSDSLWSLAHRYLGNGTRYPEIVSEHNKEVARLGPKGRLLAIKDPNLIFIGQTIIIPPRKKIPQPGNGKRHEANKMATGLQVKVVYETANDTKTWHYKNQTPDYTIEASMTATLSIENLSSDCHRSNLELVVSKDKLELEQKLSDFNNKAFKDLADGVKMSYESGRVTIKAPIATHANVGPYTFRVQADAPNHFSGSVKFEPLKGIVENKERKFKYSADAEFSVSVTVHPMPKKAPEAVRVMEPEKIQAQRNTSANIDWAKLAKNTGDFLVKLTIVVIGTLSLQARMAAGIGTTTSGMPMMYRLDLNDPKLRAQNPGMI